VILTCCKRKHLSSCFNICHNLHRHQHIIFVQPSVYCIVTMENIFQLQYLIKWVTTLSLFNWKYLLKSLQFCIHVTKNETISSTCVHRARIGIGATECRLTGKWGHGGQNNSVGWPMHNYICGSSYVEYRLTMCVYIYRWVYFVWWLPPSQIPPSTAPPCYHRRNHAPAPIDATLPRIPSMPPLPLDCSSEFAAFEVRQAAALDCKRCHPTPPPSTLPLIPIGDACPHRTLCRCLQLLSGASTGPRTALPSFARDREPRTAANIKSRTAAPTGSGASCHHHGYPHSPRRL
jgi:hypothetical protein